MPMRRRPRKQAKTDPVVVTGEGLIPGSGDAVSGAARYAGAGTLAT